MLLILFWGALYLENYLIIQYFPLANLQHPFPETTNIVGFILIRLLMHNWITEIWE